MSKMMETEMISDKRAKKQRKFNKVDMKMSRENRKSQEKAKRDSVFQPGDC